MFGYSSTPEECQEVDLKTQVTEEDWILVETDNEVATPTELNPTAAVAVELSSNNSRNPADTILVESRVSPECNDDLGFHNETLAVYQLDTDSDASPLPHSPELLCFISGGTSESWIMDPPPCFTASQDGSSETSVLHTPMENLLIEHPSMSVYDSYSRTINSDGEDDSDDDHTDNEGNDEPRNVLEDVHRPSSPFEEVALPIMPIINRPSVATRSASSVPCPKNSVQTYRMMLQRQTYEQSRYLKKKSLNRSNKLHEYSHLGKHQRHRARYQCPSGRMNGRYGQRRAY